MCEAVGDQNRGANSRAIAELIDLGFIECTSAADHAYARAREYRITFINTGEGKNRAPATHEYEQWRLAAKTKKFGGAKTAPTNVQTGAETAPLIGNHLSTADKPSPRLANIPAPARAAEPITVDVDELRLWVQAVIRQLGNAQPLARDSGVPEPTLSRFRNGKGLPRQYHLPLQMACGRALPFIKYKAATA